MPRGVCRGYLPRGVSGCQGGVSACQGEGCVCLICPSVQGVSACQGAVCLVCRGEVSGRHPPMWTEFLTHSCENITFPQLRLWMVARMHSSSMHTDRYSGCH